MAQKILLRRGTQAQLVAAVTTVGEILFTNDTGNVYVADKDNAKVLIGRVLYGATGAKPATRVAGTMFYDTTTAEYFLDNGTSLVKVNATSLDEIADTANWKKVQAADVTDGRVTVISSGTDTVTATQARAHIDTANIHRAQDDAQTSTTTLWSSKKTADSISDALYGLSWKNPVTGVGAELPTTPDDGDRFVLTTDGKVYTYTAGTTNAWDTGLTPVKGWALLRKSDMTQWSYNGSAWIQINGASGLTAGVGIDISGNTVSVVLGAGIAELPTGEVGVDIAAGGGLELSNAESDAQIKIKPDVTTTNVAPINLTSNGAGVKVDGDTLVVDAGAVKIADSGVDTLQIADLAVSTGKIADGAATAVKLASDSVTTIKIVDANVTAAKLAADSVTTVKIVDANVTNAKLAIAAASASKIDPDIAGDGLSKLTTGAINLVVDTDTFSIDGTSNALTLDLVDGGPF